MPVFDNSETLRSILGGFFHFLLTQPEMRKKLLDSKLIIKFIYAEPPLSITIDLSKPDTEPEITFDDTIKVPEVEMKMKADVAHRFWLGKVNLVIALTRREIIAKGPIPKILKLLPVIKPAYELYPIFLKEKGFEKYLLMS